MPFMPGEMLVYFIVPFLLFCAAMFLGALVYEKWPGRKPRKR